jgi:thiamine-phosphate pyrophosphorylase
MPVTTDVDYRTDGPIGAPGGRPAPGLPLVSYAAGRATAQPWFAMGGITPDNLDEVLDAGARRIVVDRSITQSDDPASVVTELVGKLRDIT